MCPFPEEMELFSPAMFVAQTRKKYKEVQNSGLQSFGVHIAFLAHCLRLRTSENTPYAKLVNTAVPRSYRAVAPGVTTPGRYYEFLMYRNEAPYCT